MMNGLRRPTFWEIIGHTAYPMVEPTLRSAHSMDASWSSMPPMADRVVGASDIHRFTVPKKKNVAMKMAQTCLLPKTCFTPSRNVWCSTSTFMSRLSALSLSPSDGTKKNQTAARTKNTMPNMV